MVRIAVEKLTKAAFAPFGEVIELCGANGKPVNGGTATSYRDLARVDVGEGGRTSVNFIRASPRAMPLTITELECHPLASQAFLPCRAIPFMVVVAPAGKVDPASVRAFVTHGWQGVNYRKGVWHHALICLREESEFIVVDRAGDGVNYEEVTLGAPLLVEYPIPEG